ncbi:MAG: AGE family epimerase/isomerase [Verrucomicrobiales bacterium]|nr:AGE family epimerase/isomerase [Verrucomicrobiales bacterium]
MLPSSQSDRYEIGPEARARFQDRVRAQLYSHILPFWCGPALNAVHGGWMPWLSNNLQPDFSKPQGLILNARLLWTFSAVYLARPEPMHRRMAERAFEIVLGKFWDNEHGGAVWRLDNQWRVLDDSKKTYGQAFCIYALAEYHRAFGSELARARAIELFELLETYAHDPVNGGYVEVCARNWTEAGPGARLSEKDMPERKSMNCHLHVLEAFTNLYRIWPDRRVAARLRELVELFETRILDRSTFHLRHFFNDAWEARSDTYTFGHDIEASWLLCEAADTLAEPQLFGSVRPLALRMAETTLDEGVDTDGGLVYEGRAGRIVDSGKEWWPQAEAVVGFINAYQISGDEQYLGAALRVWEFIEGKVVDRVHGEWYWRIGPDGKPDNTLPKVSEWKDPYHAVRACLEVLRRLGSGGAARYGPVVGPESFGNSGGPASLSRRGR